ncbi:MAG: alpha/beta fold hydrolase [Candidatus Eremiobacteraeota bacterium]|nr:alpha/beta fold hydrolase [Candidatus Eremiobacteraeota bacterium]
MRHPSIAAPRNYTGLIAGGLVLIAAGVLGATASAREAHGRSQPTADGVAILLTGTVTDETKHAVPSASVELVSSNVALSRRVRRVAQAETPAQTHFYVETDAAGKYELLRRVGQGAYDLVVSAVGDAVATRKIDLSNDGQKIQDIVLHRLPAGAPAAPYAQRRIYYATDRAESTGKTFDYADGAFSPDESALPYKGRCTVSVQWNDDLSSAFGPNTYRRVEESSERGQAVVDSVAPPIANRDFFGPLISEARRSRSKTIAVFVHGYNQGFDDGARAAAQLQYEMRFDGPIVAYSWPSAHRLDGYPHDEAQIPPAADHFQRFIQELRANAGKGISIAIIAHSMGNRLAVETLKNVPDVARASVLAAPDVPVQEFETAYTNVMRGTTSNLTLYASQTDQALLASLVFHQDQRIGTFDNVPFTATGMDTVDATQVDTSFLGHSYFVDSAIVARDIASFLAKVPPSKRTHLTKRIGAGKIPYWQVNQ